jgi:alkanesulfonate monooxygenase SsuD/methylene tetrahydromethanopterin reductase-like flavin-dependent oxidoreductase (luciferase family)
MPDRASRMADGWLAVGHTPRSIARKLARIRAGRARAETLDGRFSVSARAEPADRAELAKWRDAGVDRLIVSLAALRSLASGARILTA